MINSGGEKGIIGRTGQYPNLECKMQNVLPKFQQGYKTYKSNRTYKTYGPVLSHSTFSASSA